MMLEATASPSIARLARAPAKRHAHHDQPARRGGGTIKHRPACSDPVPNKIPPRQDTAADATAMLIAPRLHTCSTRAVPTTLQALLVFMVGLLPGAAYAYGFERHTIPQRAAAVDRILRLLTATAVVQAVLAPVTYQLFRTLVATGRIATGRPLPAWVWVVLAAYSIVPLLVGDAVGRASRRGRSWARVFTAPSPAPRGWDHLFRREDVTGWVRLRLLDPGTASGPSAAGVASGVPLVQDLVLRAAQVVVARGLGRQRVEDVAGGQQPGRRARRAARERAEVDLLRHVVLSPSRSGPSAGRGAGRTAQRDDCPLRPGDAPTETHGPHRRGPTARRTARRALRRASWAPTGRATVLDPAAGWAGRAPVEEGACPGSAAGRASSRSDGQGPSARRRGDRPLPPVGRRGDEKSTACDARWGTARPRGALRHACFGCGQRGCRRGCSLLSGSRTGCGARAERGHDEKYGSAGGARLRGGAVGVRVGVRGRVRRDAVRRRDDELPGRLGGRRAAGRAGAADQVQRRRAVLPQPPRQRRVRRGAGRLRRPARAPGVPAARVAAASPPMADRLAARLASGWHRFPVGHGATPTRVLRAARRRPFPSAATAGRGRRRRGGRPRP